MKTKKNIKLISLNELKQLALKYNLSQSGSKFKLANSLSSLRGAYLSKQEKSKILPLLKNNVNKRILIKNKTRKKFIK
jgi:hypothetical protein